MVEKIQEAVVSYYGQFEQAVDAPESDESQVQDPALTYGDGLEGLETEDQGDLPAAQDSENAERLAQEISDATDAPPLPVEELGEEAGIADCLGGDDLSAEGENLGLVEHDGEQQENAPAAHEHTVAEASGDGESDTMEDADGTLGGGHSNS